MTARFLAWAALAVTLPLPAFAHHGWSGYDADRVLNLSGTIESVSYGNPHVHLRLKTADKSWDVVLAPPSRMTTRGLPEGSLSAGQSVQVLGYPHREQANEMRAERLTLDGKTTELR